MSRSLLLKTSALLGAAIGLGLPAASAQAAAWSKSYAMEWFEPAFYFGAKDTRAADAKGTDCPNGINPALDYKSLFVAAGYDPAEATEVVKPEGPKSQLIRSWAANRGPNKTNIYQHPEAWPDPGMIEVTGDIAEGFDLDNNPNTGFKSSPDGKTHGVDNAFYKVGGCTLRWRGSPRDAYYHKYANDNMRDGKYTIVMVVSGNGSPMNDPDAKFAFYTTKDKLVKDGNGAVAADYTFKVDPDPRYQAVVPVKITNGVIEMQAPTDFTMRDYESDARAGGQLKLFKAQMKLRIKADGTLSGLLGGYMPWQLLHDENNDYIRELTGHMNASALWYALQREADGVPDPKTGKNTAISITYRLDAVPAFVIDPKGANAVTVAQTFQPDASTLASIKEEQTQLAQSRLRRIGAN